MALFHFFPVIMLFFLNQTLAISSTYMSNIKPSLSLHWVYENNAHGMHTILIWGIFFVWILLSMEGIIAMVMRNCLPFLIIDANSPYSQKMKVLYIHIGAENDQNLRPIFEKNTRY